MNFINEIKKLKAEKNAVILAHYYQEDDIQEIADFTGDSLALAQYAQKTQADTIVFCGVHFMAETAKILNPHKTVLLPDLKAGCSLADHCQAPALQEFMKKYPDHKIVAYINCNAEVKAMADIICTSSNAQKVVESLKTDKIVFVPDRFLGRYINQQTHLNMVLWPGSCFVHESFSLKKLILLKIKNPQAVVLAHPECPEYILKEAHIVGSTSKLINATKNYTEPQQFIVVTEPGVLFEMKKYNPQHEYIPAPPENNCACNFCPYMRLNTLEKLYLCLLNNTPQIQLSDEIIHKAQKSLFNMLAVST